MAVIRARGHLSVERMLCSLMHLLTAMESNGSRPWKNRTEMTLPRFGRKSTPPDGWLKSLKFRPRMAAHKPQPDATVLPKLPQIIPYPRVTALDSQTASNGHVTGADSLAASAHLEANNNHSTDASNGIVRSGVKLPPLLPSHCSTASSVALPSLLHPPVDDDSAVRMIHSATKLPPIAPASGCYRSARPSRLAGWTERAVCPAQLLIEQRRMQGVQSLEESASSEDEIEREIREVNSSTASGYSSADHQEGGDHLWQPGETDQWQQPGKHLTSQPQAKGQLWQPHRRTGEQPSDGCHRDELRLHQLQLAVRSDEEEADWTDATAMAAATPLIERHWRSAKLRQDSSEADAASVRSKTAHPSLSRYSADMDEDPHSALESSRQRFGQLHLQPDRLRESPDGAPCPDDDPVQSPPTPSFKLPASAGAGVASEDGLSALDRLKLLLNNNEQDVESLVPVHVTPPGPRPIDYDSIPVGRKTTMLIDYLPHVVHPEADEAAEAAGGPVRRSESANSFGSGQSATAAADSVKRRPAVVHKTSKSLPSVRKSIASRYRGSVTTGGRPSQTKPSEGNASGQAADADSKTALPTAIKRMDSSVFSQQAEVALDPRTALQTAMKKMASTDWEVKVDGLRQISQLSKENGDVVQSEMHSIILAVLGEIRNLRSQVSRMAIQTVSHLFQHCGKAMEQDLDRTSQLLLHKTADTNRFIREDSHLALVSMIDYISPPKAIVAIVTEGASHKNATVRAEAARLLASLVQKMGGAKALSGAKDVTERILPAAAQFLQEGSPDARAEARKIFCALINEPVFDKAMQKYLPVSVLRSIQRTVDALRAQHAGATATRQQNGWRIH